MSSPCGKCNACPCGTGGTNGGSGQQPPKLPSETSQQQQQQAQSCLNSNHCDLRGGTSKKQTIQQQQHPSSGGCQVNVYQPPPPPQQHTQRPHVDCICTQNRERNRGPPVQAPLADNYTCSRPQRVAPPLALETRCNCREKSKKLDCHCAPPVVHEVAPPQSPTHANVTCGQATYQGPPRYERRSQCGHCRSQRKRKKCCIQ